MTPQRRWHCPHCQALGWSSDGRMPPHDRAYGGSCRASGQVSEGEAMHRLARRLAGEMKRADLPRNRLNADSW